MFTQFWRQYLFSELWCMYILYLAGTKQILNPTKTSSFCLKSENEQPEKSDNVERKKERKKERYINVF